MAKLGPRQVGMVLGRVARFVKDRKPGGAVAVSRVRARARVLVGKSPASRFAAMLPGEMALPVVGATAAIQGTRLGLRRWKREEQASLPRRAGRAFASGAGGAAIGAVSGAAALAITRTIFRGPKFSKLPKL